MKTFLLYLRQSPLWPTLLSGLLGPGLGQIVNRDYKKAALLIGLSIISLVWFSKALVDRLAPLLPGTPDQWRNNQDAFQTAVITMLRTHNNMFLTFQLLMLVLWGYGIVDAYLSARERLKRKSSDQETANSER